jgi:hypothetical protein
MLKVESLVRLFGQRDFWKMVWQRRDGQAPGIQAQNLDPSRIGRSAYLERQLLISVQWIMIAFVGCHRSGSFKEMDL